METFIAVIDKAEGNAAKLVDEENNNFDKVKVLIITNRMRKMNLYQKSKTKSLVK